MNAWTATLILAVALDLSAAHAARGRRNDGPSTGPTRIIVAFDGSPRAEDALALALRLRDPDEGVLTLACVVPGRRWHVPAHAHRPDAAVPDEIERMFADARAATIPAGIRVQQRAPVAPSAARGLTELAEAEGADLVVVGSNRHCEPGRVAIDRTAGRLLQGAPCAVAVAPAGMRSTEPFRHVGIAYDGSPEAAAAPAAGYEIAARSGAAVTLLCALEPLRRPRPSRPRPTPRRPHTAAACMPRSCSTPPPTPHPRA